MFKTMVLSNFTLISPRLSNNSKVSALESTLQQCVANFRDLLMDYEQVIVENETNKQLCLTHINKCESKTCAGSEELKNIISSKERLIQNIASSITKLNDTKDWNVLSDIFQILFDDNPVNPTNIKVENISPKQELVSPRQEVSITEEVSFNEESLSEIEGTPGRTSPIIPTKKTKSFGGKSLESRDKKKCPASWSTPESKSIKLIYPTPTRSKKTGKYRQSRISLVKVKQTSVVDLTCSPEASGGTKSHVLPLIKKESIENDDTILPSPTSSTSFNLLKTTVKDSPSKFRRPLSLKTKTEKLEADSTHKENKNDTKIDEITAMEESINLLNPKNRYNGLKKEVQNVENIENDEDATYCECNSSLSLLENVNKMEKKVVSPSKRPLEENKNIVNTPPKQALQQTTGQDNTDKVKRKLPELVEHVYKEPAVRNKQEKRNLPGWSCEECKHFFGELYKHDPEMLSKKINDCSKHRGRHNPERPKTPPNFWNPRLHVADDTEEFNRMNNAQ